MFHEVFDPKGDVLLVLTLHNPSDNYESNSASETGDTEEVESQPAKAGPTKHNSIKALVNEDSESEEVEVLVSSRHLALASPVFRVMFDGDFLEKITLGQSEPKRIPLPEDNYEAMIVLLRIIHGQNSKVPRSIDPKSLIEIATLVDKYELLDACQMHVDVWMNTSCLDHVRAWRELADWIYITWIFQKGNQFQELTRRAIWEMDHYTEISEVSLPESITSKRKTRPKSSSKKLI
ncbi:hypothetical protein H2200_009963 [Cladophialophora chaetospira]|uniref:BTB domain-containing protein n=1 Tax=Cladophialophora chaetospira TaxID=386627 RepID=A0AA38X1X9_9EURO|nr:hypothetical protein H2200_009963 [Cladophialophora chaetospira]